MKIEPVVFLLVSGPDSGRWMWILRGPRGLVEVAGKTYVDRVGAQTAAEARCRRLNNLAKSCSDFRRLA